MLSVYMEPVQSIPRHSTAKLLDLKIRKNYLWKSRHPPHLHPHPPAHTYKSNNKYGKENENSIKVLSSKI